MKAEKVKRIFDMLVSGMALVILSPVLLAISIAIKLDSRGRVIFKQKRLGINGTVFCIYKFRTMVPDAEKMAAGLFNYENDPRVTKVGRFLRNSSLDELPLLFIVWNGFMSVVGPRRGVVYLLGQYKTLNGRYKKRFEVRPGITGLAQIKGRNENDWEEKVRYDNRYIDLFQKYGGMVDIKILFHTVVKVFQRSNICERKIDAALSDEESARLAQEEIIRKAHETV